MTTVIWSYRKNSYQAGRPLRHPNLLDQLVEVDNATPPVACDVGAAL